MNSVAGGGTFLTFPLLSMLGFTPSQGNVLSTIALWPGTVASAFAYRREWREQREILPALLLISVCGAVIGAGIFLLTPEQSFARMVPWLLLAATLIFTFGRYVIARAHFIRRPGVARLMQFGIAVYGGYFGAGIGILMLAMLQLMGLSHIHRMNALKTLLGTAINGVTVAVFLLFADIDWRIAAIMAAGAVAGGYAGAHFAQKLPPAPVRLMVSAIGFSMTGYFFLR